MTTEDPKNYQVLSHIDQILKRPDSYVGNIENVIQDELVLRSTEFIRDKINYNEALVRIFIEPLCNAIDNISRSNGVSKQTYIKITISDTQISFSNDGKGIPIEEKNSLYIPETIFGTLLSSSNYNDSKERKTSGRNGLGIKLTNIFSIYFHISITDIDRKLSYSQEWGNHMKTKNSPTITTANKNTKHNVVSLAFKPDLKYFGVDNLTHLIPYFCKKVVDAAFVCSPVKVYLNNSVISMQNIKDYAKYYISEIPKDKLSVKNSDYELLILPNNTMEDNDSYIISFVNGIETPSGGVHVDTITSSIYEYYSNKFKTQKFVWKDIKRFFHIFIKCEVDKPSFRSQLKEKLTGPKIKIEIPVSSFSKWEITSIIKEYLENKNDKKLKDSLQKSKKQKIEGYDSANKIGTKDSHKCILIITEGLSAKTFATVGIKHGCLGVSGRDYFGIYPIRGKLLNVRNASNDQIQKNREVNDIMQILNIKNGKSYGKILLLTDADVDGSHIEGLFINFIEVLCPDMVNSIYTMRTPILKIPNSNLYFYDEYKANDYLLKNKIRNVKYFKGLGSNSHDEISDVFGANVIQYSYNKSTDLPSLELAFSAKKTFSDKRKDWLGNYQRCYIDDDSKSSITVSSFINKEFIRFSIDDCYRSIPSIMDGLKVSQRKVLYGAFKKRLKYEGNAIKVAQLGGYIAEITNYHHGENNLYETIIRMTHEFVGSNNIALLYPEGMFGSRLLGGKDSASPRYIFTKQNLLTSLVFRNEDSPLLAQISEIDDGDIVEPKYFLPIIPMVLVNGSVGIGTGYSTCIPCYNPSDIIDIILKKLDSKTYQDITPYYKGFKGKILKISEYKYETKGIIVSKTSNVYEISELPINLWIDDFKNYLDGLSISKKILYENQSTTNEPLFRVTIMDNKTDDVINEINQKLTSFINTSNMVCLDINKNIKKYNNIQEIIDEYYKIRLENYEKRRLWIISDLEIQLCIINNKYRFIKSIIEEKINIYKKKEKEVTKILKSNSFDTHPIDNNYDYLIDLKFRHTSLEKLEELKKEIDSISSSIDYYKSISDKKLWKKELLELKNSLK